MNTMKKRGSTALLALLIVGLTAGSAFAEREPRGPRGPQCQGPNCKMHHRPMMKFFQTLPDATKAKLMQLKLKKKQAMLPLKAELKLLGAKLRVELSSASPNKGTIERLIQKKLAIKGKLMRLKVNHKLEVKSLLTGKHLEMYNMHLLKGERKGKRGHFGPHRWGGKGRF